MAINNAKLNNICMAEELFVATERNAKLSYVGYKRLILSTPSWAAREVYPASKKAII